LVVKFDRVKRTETGQGKKLGHGSRKDRETLRAGKGAKKRDYFLLRMPGSQPIDTRLFYLDLRDKMAQNYRNLAKTDAA